MSTATVTRRCRIRVWYGETTIADCTAVPRLAKRYATTRPLVDVHITREPITSQPATPARS